MTKELILIAGPCVIESEKQLLNLAKQIKEFGIEYLRGRAFKMRSSPDSFQGLGETGLKYLLKAKEKYGLKIVSEIVSIKDIYLFKKYKIDFIQIGARNMDNYPLLKEIAKQLPNSGILIKRGFHATKKEYLEAINYLLKYGHKGKIIACERGIRTFADGEYSRFILDMGIVSDLKQDKSFNLSIIVDPSHAAGRKKLVKDLALSGIAAGADGLIIEIKEDNSKKLLCDDAQAITIKELKEIIDKSKKIFEVIKGN
jgi:3-deoxy-7-phosphoheptulonate synthase